MLQDLLVSLFGLPVRETLVPGIFLGVQEGIIQLPMQLTCSTVLHPESAADCGFQTKETLHGLQIYLLAIYQPIFFTKKKRANELAR